MSLTLETNVHVKSSWLESVLNELLVITSFTFFFVVPIMTPVLDDCILTLFYLLSAIDYLDVSR